MSVSEKCQDRCRFKGHCGQTGSSDQVPMNLLTLAREAATSRVRAMAESQRHSICTPARFRNYWLGHVFELLAAQCLGPQFQPIEAFRHYQYDNGAPLLYRTNHCQKPDGFLVKPTHSTHTPNGSLTITAVVEIKALTEADAAYLVEYAFDHPVQAEKRLRNGIPFHLPPDPSGEHQGFPIILAPYCQQQYTERLVAGMPSPVPYYLAPDGQLQCVLCAPEPAVNQLRRLAGHHIDSLTTLGYTQLTPLPFSCRTINRAIDQYSALSDQDRADLSCLYIT